MNQWLLMEYDHTVVDRVSLGLNGRVLISHERCNRLKVDETVCVISASDWMSSLIDLTS